MNKILADFNLKLSCPSLSPSPSSSSPSLFLSSPSLFLSSHSPHSFPPTPTSLLLLTQPPLEPEKDSVIQIANMVVQQGEKEPFIKNVFTLDDCAAIVGSEVICFPKAKEAELLRVSFRI